MLQLNRDFLRGRSPCTPYHIGAIDSETTPLLSGLLRLHDYGLLTVQSQPSKHTDPHFCPAFDRTGSPEGWYEYRQRAFVDFLIPTDGSIPLEQVKHFCLSLAEHPDIDTKIGAGLSHTLKYGDSEVPPFLTAGRKSGTSEDDRMIISTCSPQTTWEISSQPLSDKRWVSSASRKRDLESVPWKTATAAPKETEEEYWSDFLPRLVTLVQPLIVFVCVKSWQSRLDIEALIRELADIVGIQDSFRESPHLR